MNTFTIVGRIGHDVEVKQAGQTTVAVFNVATDVGFGDKKQSDWYRCQLWGKRAEGGLIQYLVKGAQVVVSGELKQYRYHSDGVDKVSMDININDVALVGGQKQDNGFQQPQQQHPSGTGGGQYQQQAEQTTSVSESSPAGQNFEDDIPF